MSVSNSVNIVCVLVDWILNVLPDIDFFIAWLSVDLIGCIPIVESFHIFEFNYF